MCGRFTLFSDYHVLAERFGFDPGESAIEPRYNIAPGQLSPVVVNDGVRRLRMMKWGLIPSWSNEERAGRGSKMINARAETLTERPAFKKPFRERRCLVLADGFYEWAAAGRGKKERVPMRIFLKSGEPFAMAGLWDSWARGVKSGGVEPVFTFTIITTEPNELISPIHHRMPVILSPQDEELWIDSSFGNVEALRSLLKPYDSDEMDMHAVSTVVNSPKNDSPACVKRVEAPPAENQS